MEMDQLFDRLNQLTEEEKNRLSDAKKKALKILVGSKPFVSFSHATLEDCSNTEGLALDLRFIEGVDAPPSATLHIPEGIVTPVPSDFLCEHLLIVQKFFALNNETAFRMLIDAVLIEVLRNEAKHHLRGFCEVKNDWEGPGFGYTGNVDYMIGSSQSNSLKNMDTFLLVVEAKKEWPDDAVAQVLCEAGCLLRKRMAKGKNTPVFAVLTNGRFFRFFAIDTDNVVYSSATRMLEIDDGTYKSSSSLSEILRWFHWFLSSIKSISPRASRENLTPEMVTDSLDQLRTCFGPKNKKVRL